VAIQYGYISQGAGMDIEDTEEDFKFLYLLY